MYLSDRFLSAGIYLLIYKNEGMADVCIRNLHHNDLITGDEAFCFSSLFVSPSYPCCLFFSLLFLKFLISSPPLPPSVRTPCPLPDGDHLFTDQKKKEKKFNEVHFKLNLFSLSLSLTPIPLTFLLSAFLPLSLPLVQYQMEMMRSLRHVNIDHLHVGWYQSTYYGSFVSRALLDSQFSYQHAIEESVVLIYGK